MEENENSLKKRLEELAKSGIRADKNKLKKDMVSQFSDFREWAREYACNAFDAQANICLFHGIEKDDETTTIIVEDDGHGMNKEGIINFFTIYKSEKQGDKSESIGRHGIGKLSVAAIPGQCGFKLITSDGTEGWEIEMGSLLDDSPFKAFKLDVAPKHGTRFEITFKRILPLREELQALQKVLETYVKYLDMDIRIMYPVDDPEPNPESEIQSLKYHPVRIRKPWISSSIFSQVYRKNIGSKQFEIVLEAGKRYSEIYQNRVFINNSYNLLGYSNDQDIQVPYLGIRVNSPDFELPFGRHRLSNEEVVPKLSHLISGKLLPDFFNRLAIIYEQGKCDEFGIPAYYIEEMSAAMLLFFPNLNESWSHIKIFREHHHCKISYAELENQVTSCGKLYIEENIIEGLDYDSLRGPVLFRDQPVLALEFVKRCYAHHIIRLDGNDLVFEAEDGVCPPLSLAEKRFEKMLGFFPDYSMEILSQDAFENLGKSNRYFDINFFDRYKGISDNFSRAREEFKKFKWKLKYLLENDNKTPCTRLKFTLKNDTVTLNLYHPEISKLSILSEQYPELAGHFAMAICLTENNKALSHVAADIREDLILLDAMARIQRNQSGQTGGYDRQHPIDPQGPYLFGGWSKDGNFTNPF